MMTPAQRYFEEMAMNEDLELIDNEKWIELEKEFVRSARFRPAAAKPPPRVNPIGRVVSNLTLAVGIGLFIAWLASLVGVPTWFAFMCGGACSIVYCILWAGSFEDSRNA